jgi:hypothetical protein
VIVWLDQMIRRAGRPDLTLLSAGDFVLVAAVVSAGTVGAVLASRRPRHAVGWLLLALAVSVVASGLVQWYASYGLLVRPGAFPAVRYAAVLDDVTFIVWPPLVGFVLLLTPTGHLPSRSRRWRWWAVVTVVAPVVYVLAAALRPEPLEPPYQSISSPLGIPGLAAPILTISLLALAVAQVAVVVGGASLFLRFRRATGGERQQLRWVALAGGLSAFAAVLVLLGSLTEIAVLYVGAALLYLALLPVVLGAAILRYRLYDLDRIISRTLAYALLTVLLGGTYAAVVLGLGQLVGQDRALLVAASTLALAMAFQPARRRIQDLVDRRFNRRRYDAAQTIQAFSLRLRQQVDLDVLRTELLAVVDQTWQPTRASLWLRPTQRP